ncbi:MAG: hypothetical protein R3C20_21475, partial [Planctomycetaceae bacterium]
MSSTEHLSYRDESGSDVDAQFTDSAAPAASPAHVTLGAGKHSARGRANSVPGSMFSKRGSIRRGRRQPPKWMLKFQATLQSLTRRMKQLPEWAKQHRRQCGTFLASLLIHSLIALLLSLWMIQPEFTEQIFTLIAGATKPAEDIAFVEVAEIVQPESLDRTDLDSTMKQLLSDANDGLNSHEMDDPLDRKFQITADLLSAGLEIPVHLGEFGGRSKAGRQAAVHRFGGTANSEKAVNSGLKWLASIQREDGSWSFSEVGQAGSPGAMGQTDMGATALALLCFLGGGHTHTTNGEYRELVTKGLEYLRKNAELFSYGADLRGTYQGNSGMYVQGIASICICEAAAMSPDDQELRKLAINSIDFIERAQDR